jgi:hypothetical protein
MTSPRSTLVSVADTPWYHLVSRCVRRAFLCGQDAASGRSFEHRRGWIAERIRVLSGIFAMDVAAYAVMSNHYHLVLHIDSGRAEAWSDEEVLRRWTRLFRGPEPVRRWLADPGAPCGDGVRLAIQGYVETYRARLQDVSWFMRVLNETIARQANLEDGVTGRFWEGRFKSQALLDDQAVLTAMAYVDLNPIRAGLADTPETSEYTSISERIALLRGGHGSAEVEAGGDTTPASVDRSGEEPALSLVSCARSSPYRLPGRRGRADPSLDLQPESVLRSFPKAPLMPFDATGRMNEAIPFAFDDYLDLMEMTGRVIREDKRGFIPSQVPNLLTRLQIDPESFVTASMRMVRQFGHSMGTPEHLTDLIVARQARYMRGLNAARNLFGRRAA